jgi:hypothetical protein
MHMTPATEGNFCVEGGNALKLYRTMTNGRYGSGPKNNFFNLLDITVVSSFFHLTSCGDNTQVLLTCLVQNLLKILGVYLVPFVPLADQLL